MPTNSCLCVQVEDAKEAKLKGPHSFPLQRLLLLYGYLRSSTAVDERDDADVAEDMLRGGPGACIPSGRLAKPARGAGLHALHEQQRPEGSASPSDLQQESEGEKGEGEEANAAAAAIQRQRQQYSRRMGCSSGGADSVGGGVESADLLMQISTLAAMNLISQVRIQMHACRVKRN